MQYGWGDPKDEGLASTYHKSNSRCRINNVSLWIRFFESPDTFVAVFGIHPIILMVINDIVRINVDDTIIYGFIEAIGWKCVIELLLWGWIYLRWTLKRRSVVICDHISQDISITKLKGVVRYYGVKITLDELHHLYLKNVIMLLDGSCD